MSLLARLVGAWRTTYDEALVEPITRLGEQLAAARPPLRARTQAALESLWKATLAAGDPLDVERLFAARWPKQPAPLQERLGALAAAPPDPRFAAKLLDLRSRYPSGVLDVAISRVLARCPTMQLEVLLDAYRATAFGRARIALERVQRRPCDPRLLEEARAALAPAVEQRTAPALRARPMDSATRSVLADELQAAGDPRGDFIAMQLAIANGTAGPAVVKRAAKLLETHVDTWLRPFPNAIAHACRFERGFPVAVVSGARGRALDQAIDRPEWATIEELTIDGRDADLERLLHRLPLLRALSTRDEVLERLRGPHPYIRSLGTPTTWFPPDRDVFPNLAVLAGRWACDAEDYDPLQRRAVALGLHAITYVRASDFGESLAALPIGPPEMRVTITSGQDRGWMIALQRDERTAAIAWAGGSQYTSTLVGEIMLQLAAAQFRDIAICADGRALENARYCLRGHRRRFGDANVRFDGAMIDLAAVPKQSPVRSGWRA